ncbi:hypothetical protein HMPREF9098_1868 [Kingella denitrificans ATCC 33394]|uniref:Uncharacterized protein n=1 Tax=Kingella denitrificans ATCC 33394 TaxID=888741 RepID=F0F183_9NEIS|nr:hypothetical protein HMPREF9098_1868 [Kingella denitrificans ATCC 33394]
MAVGAVKFLGSLKRLKGYLKASASGTSEIAQSSLHLPQSKYGRSLASYPKEPPNALGLCLP